MRVLFVGTCSSFFLVPLVQALKKNDPNFSASVLGLRNPAGELQESEKSVFNEIIDYPSETITGSKLHRLRRALLQILRQKGFGFLLGSLFKGSVRSAITNAESDLTKLLNNKLLGNLGANYDLVQVHYLKKSNLELASNFDRSKMILSFWGSDLLQDEDEKTRIFKQKMMAQAALITVQNEELAQTIAVKYGWNYRGKIRTNLFLPNQAVLQSIAKANKKDAREFLGKFGSIKDEKKIIVTGYNPNPQSQQLAIIEQLKKTATDSFSKNYHFVFTFIYAKGGQRDELLRTVEDMGCTCSIIDRYLSDEEMGMLRKGTDIYLHFPQTDAFSTTLLEHLYANNTVVTGTWLPYGKHRTYGVYMKEIERISDLGTEHLQFEEKFEENQGKIDLLIQHEQTAQTWSKIYKEAKNSSRKA